MAITRILSGTLSASGSANVKGSYSQMTASTSEDVKAVWVSYINFTASTVARWSYDVGVGAAASEVVYIADIHRSTGNDDRGSVPCFYLPISIASGSRIAARVACSTGGATNVQFVLHLVGGSSSATSVTYGITTNQGIQVDPGAVLNTYGSYSQITAATSANFAYVVVLLSNNANNAPTNMHWDMDLAVGAAAAEAVVIDGITFSANANSDHLMPAAHAFPLTILSGTRLSARAAANHTDATDRLFRVSLITSTAVVT